MKLTRILYYYVKLEKVPGRIDRGMRQRYQPVTSKLKYEALKRIILEQNNLDILKLNYLNQTENDKIERMQSKQDEKIKETNTNDDKQSKLIRHGLLSNHLNHLNVIKRWE
ncbi:hypothetical protein A3Q56_06460 [Intoshia linei]|uniref:Uncharacterized protein n=1 Tax=Intoshia linei TaxID=1819745 RepID=A0A177AV04_9BILA|nr:hypothetical protein A3Q56_06460 [Intoshia linei]